MGKICCTIWGTTFCTTGNNFCTTGKTFVLKRRFVVLWGTTFVLRVTTFVLRGRLLYYGEDLLYYGEQLLYYGEQLLYYGAERFQGGCSGWFWYWFGMSSGWVWMYLGCVWDVALFVFYFLFCKGHPLFAGAIFFGYGPGHESLATPSYIYIYIYAYGCPEAPGQNTTISANSERTHLKVINKFTTSFQHLLLAFEAFP